jgi:hypothetical protein
MHDNMAFKRPYGTRGSLIVHTPSSELLGYCQTSLRDWKMHGLVSNLTAAVLALHTVLGCCWHHAHSCTETCSADRVVRSSEGGVEEHGCDSGTRTDGHHGRHDCRGSTCVLAASARADVPRLALQFDAPPAAAVPSHGASADDAGRDTPFYPPDALLPPLRLHLAHQVLLI